MALVDCPECSKQVSSAATSCPGCGHPIADRTEAQAAGARLTTVQSTSKRLKLQSLIAGIMLIVGVLMMFGAEEVSGMPAWLTLIGAVWFLVVRFRIWWHHG